MKIINYSDLPLEKIYQGNKPYSEKGIQLFKDYVQLVDAFYYGRASENFDKLEAIKLARKEKKLNLRLT